MKLESIVNKIYSNNLHSVGEGKVAQYIPALANIDPNRYGISVITLDGREYNVGDWDFKFSIQSISKVFTLSKLSTLIGEDIWKYVGREPSGNSFNSLVQLEYEKGIPRNPYINAGALVITDRLISHLSNPKESILELVRGLAGSEDINFDETIANSEFDTSERNRALTYLMKSFGNLDNGVEEVIDLYCKQCSISMNSYELAKSFLYLANGGINPLSKEVVVNHRSAKRINALMLTCGLYNESGDFAYRVGLPGKSGVGGGVVAIIPGKLVIAVYSPELNSNGNSYRAISTLEEFTTELGISVF